MNILYTIYYTIVFFTISSMVLASTKSEVTEFEGYIDTYKRFKVDFSFNENNDTKDIIWCELLRFFSPVSIGKFNSLTQYNPTIKIECMTGAIGYNTPFQSNLPLYTKTEDILTYQPTKSITEQQILKEITFIHIIY